MHALVVGGSPDPPTPATEGLKNLQKLVRPSVEAVERSGDRPTTRAAPPKSCDSAIKFAHQSPSLEVPQKGLGGLYIALGVAKLTIHLEYFGGLPGHVR